jgi:hypothetical protein
MHETIHFLITCCNCELFCRKLRLHSDWFHPEAASGKGKHRKLNFTYVHDITNKRKTSLNKTILRSKGRNEHFHKNFRENSKMVAIAKALLVKTKIMNLSLPVYNFPVCEIAANKCVKWNIFALVKRNMH